MKKTLQTIFFILVGLCVPLGFFMDHDPILFWWHGIPSFDVIIGGVGAFLLMMMMKFIASFASKKEDFYD
jgi:hypothetical protein